jgi:hypothetical protein
LISCFKLIKQIHTSPLPCPACSGYVLSPSNNTTFPPGVPLPCASWVHNTADTPYGPLIASSAYGLLLAPNTSAALEQVPSEQTLPAVPVFVLDAYDQVRGWG